MTLLEMKKKVLGLIEELNPDSPLLTDDPDISAKLNAVINQILFELARMKKLPRYVEMVVTAGDRVNFEDIGRECGNEVYQLNLVSGVRYEPKAGGTVLKIRQSGILEVDCFVYPEAITDKTKDSYEFELTQDLLEIMPYGVAADLLKSDQTTQYGSVYARRYSEMLQLLDPRQSLPILRVEGGTKM